MKRRDFVSASIAGALAATGKPRAATLGDVKPSLYSITYLGYWYRGDALTMEQLIQRAKEYGYAGIEIEGKRPHGCPLDWPKRRCADFRRRVADAGLAIAGVAGDNDFSSPVSEHREAQLASVRELIRMTSDLDAKVLRVFLAWTGATRLPDGGGRYDLAQRIWQFSHEGIPDEQMWSWCRQALTESARFAEEYGVTLALQNHRPIIRNYKQVLQMVREVNSPHLKVCLDAPLMENKDAAYLRQAIIDAGALQVQTHFGGEFEQEAPGKPIRIHERKGQWCGPYMDIGYAREDIYLPFLQALFETGYRGYIGYELCHPLPTVEGKTVGLPFADNSARLAAEYMRGTIAEARRRAAAAMGLA